MQSVVLWVLLKVIDEFNQRHKNGSDSAVNIFPVEVNLRTGRHSTSVKFVYYFNQRARSSLVALLLRLLQVLRGGGGRSVFPEEGRRSTELKKTRPTAPVNSARPRRAHEANQRFQRGFGDVFDARSAAKLTRLLMVKDAQRTRLVASTRILRPKRYRFTRDTPSTSQNSTLAVSTRVLSKCFLFMHVVGTILSVYLYILSLSL